jgi:UDP-2,3-diacylglucosamine hydrolase
MIPQYSSALLISDLHLTPSMPLTAQRFFDFCEKEAPKVEALFILGDLFEYWVGDDAAALSPFHQAVSKSLFHLSKKVDCFYMHGNRDFLIGNTFLEKAGMQFLPDPSMVEIAQKKYLLSHGDVLCTADLAYQQYRRWVHKAWLQKLFLLLPLSWRRAIANHLRSANKSDYKNIHDLNSAAEQIKMDVTTEACANLQKAHGFTNLIHGHTHRPMYHQENLGDQSWQRWVLSDWDLDHPEQITPRASALLIDENGVSYSNLIK